MLHIGFHPKVRVCCVGNGFAEIVYVHEVSHSHLTDIVATLGGMGAQLGGRQGWEEHAREDGDDGNDHQEFDQGETLFACADWVPDSHRRARANLPQSFLHRAFLDLPAREAVTRLRPQELATDDGVECSVLPGFFLSRPA